MSFLPLIIGASSGIAMLLYSKATSKLDAASLLDYEIKVAHLKFKSITEIELGLKITIINKSNETFTLKNPSIELSDSGKKLAENQFVNKTYELKANSKVALEKMLFSIKTLKLAGTVAKIVTAITQSWEVGKGITYNLGKATTALMSKKDEILKTMSVSVKTEVNNIPVVYNQTDLSGLGYAPGSAIDRPITACPQYDKYFAKPSGVKTIFRDKNVHDTAKLMVDVVNKDYKLIRDFSLLFKRKTVKETAEAIFDFIYKHIKYNIEDGEQLRNPLVVYDIAQRKAIAHFNKNGFWHKDYSADCDDMAMFASCILKNLNIPYTFEISSYRDSLGFDRGYSHVYVNIPQVNGNIIIDPVYHSFNERKPFSKKFNLNGNKQYINLNGMDVVYLGAGQEDKILKFLKESRIELINKKSDPAVTMMFDYAIKNWDIDREKALEYLANAEKVQNTPTNGLFGTLDMLAQGKKFRPSELNGLVTDNIKAFIQKYKIPVAIGTALFTGLVIYGVTKAIKN